MKQSFVLRALKILGLEEMLKLSEALRIKQNPLKKAAGEELIVWSDAQEKEVAREEAKKETKKEEAKVLEFKKPNEIIPEPLPEKHAEESSSTNQEADSVMAFYSSDLVLWQREMNKETSGVKTKEEAAKGYKGSSDMYVVKSSKEGQEKIRFASTNGVLVNKKQN